MASERRRPFSVYSWAADGFWDIQPILEGDFERLPPLPSRTIRVFLSSTFSDMTPERNALMEHVYPQLKTFCRQQYRLEFQMMDLRWGIREQSHDDHTIIDFCIKEIENCKRVSLGPSFVALIGQKYGYRPFPPTIGAREFELIRDELLINQVQDTSLLERWFKKNTNVIPAVYALQPISSILPNFSNTENVDLQQIALKEWTEIYKQLQQLLRKGVQSCVEHGKLSLQCKEKYFVSVTEYEIEKGMLEVENPCSSCLCFVRIIKNLEKNDRSPAAKKYLDIVDGSNEIDAEAQNLLAELQNEKIPKVLTDERNTEIFQMTWTDLETKAPSDDRAYLREFCDTFRDKMQWLINRSAQQLKNISCHPKLIEILQHLNMCRSRSQDFKGREETLRRIRLYMTNSTGRPIVLYGESGSGKTSVVAKVASHVLKWFEVSESKPVVLVRFLGTTSYSCSIRLVLGGLCWQIVSAYDENTQDIPSDYPGLVSYFKACLTMATRQRPLVLLMDGLDQLGPDHRAHSLAWLPTHLPSDVYLVVSTLPDRHELLDTLNALLPDKTNFIQILPLGSQLSTNLVKEWLHRSGRDLTAPQYDIVEKALSTCNLPLYTNLVFQEVCRWSSYSTPDQTLLESTVNRIIDRLFDRIEKYHGHVFVSHALSYLTASKNGLSDGELEDVLSLDDVVLNDVFQHWLPPLRRIPPLLLPRLQDELSSYIMPREANGTVVFYWYHGQFIGVARQRYLSDSRHKVYIHTILSHYFMGTWGAGKTKPFKYSLKQFRWLSLKAKESKADRKVPSQPLHFGSDPHDPDGLNYNLRKLSELPYHLLESRMFVDLKQQVLFDYEWLHAKLSAMSLHDVLSDFNLTLATGMRDADVLLLAGALRVGGIHVNQNPDTLAFDLIGRLLQYYDENERHDGLRRLLQQCDTLSLKHSVLIPILQCFDPPTAMLLYVLEGHSQVVSDIVFSSVTNELISVSKDGTLAFWDLGTGERSRTVDVSNLNPGRKTRVFQTNDGKYLVVDYDTLDSPVQIYDTKTGQLLYSCGARLPTQSRGFLAGNLYCRQKSIVDIETGRIVRTIDDFVTTKNYVTCAISPNANRLLIGDVTDTKLFDFTTCELLATYPGGNLPSVLSITADSRRCYAGYSNDCMFRVLDIDRESVTFGSVLSRFDCNSLLTHRSPIISKDEQKFPKELSEINISPVDANVVLLNFRRYCLVLLNTVDGNKAKLMCMKRFTPPEIIMFSALTFDGGRAVASVENFLHVWSTNNAAFLYTINIHSTPDFPLSVSPNGNFIATGSTIHTAIKVWNFDQAEKSENDVTKVYESPVDCVACARKTRFVFVKNYYGLSSSNKGYKYMDSFGIDVWNVSTGRVRTFLPLKRYGKLLQMEVSADGERMALLLNAISIWYVVVLYTKTSRTICYATHGPEYHCHVFKVSPTWVHLVTCAWYEDENEIRLWDLQKGTEVVCFHEAVSPVFTFDGQFLLYIDMSKRVICYSLKILAPVYQILTPADQLTAIPANHHLVLVTKFDPDEIEPPIVSVWNYRSQSKVKAELEGVSPKGLQDLSKDGRIAVDGFLQVFDLETGARTIAFYSEPETEAATEERSIVRLTYDGKYVVWVERLAVRVGRVEDGSIIAHTSTHERPTCLQTMDYGYLLVLGREDGHLLTMKLVDNGSGSVRFNYRPRDCEDRRNMLLDLDGCAPEKKRQMDRCFQEEEPHSLSDHEMPLAAETLIDALTKYAANVPHAVISTRVPSTAPVYEGQDSPMFARRTSRYDSSPLALLADGLRKRVSPLGGSPVSDRVCRGAIDRDYRSNTPSPIMFAKDQFMSASSLSSANGISTGEGRPLSQLRSRSAQDLHRIHSKGSADQVTVPASNSTMPKSVRLYVAQELSKLVHGGRHQNKERHQQKGHFFRNLFRTKPHE